jgi:hypothetical protein
MAVFSAGWRRLTGVRRRCAGALRTVSIGFLLRFLNCDSQGFTLLERSAPVQAFRRGRAAQLISIDADTWTWVGESANR